jgi:DNA replication protein DnaC
MDDKMQRIAPSDLSMLRSTSTERTATFSAAAAISPSSAAACPHCDGAGYYKEEVPYGHPNFGKLMPCICKQQELGQRAAEKLYEISNLGAFSEKTFKNFNPAVPGVQGAFYAAQKYAEKPQGWMVIFGNYGAGKTHLAAAIANELLTTHHRVLFAVVPDLLDHLRATFGPSSEVEYDERFESIRDVQVLFLDDLGTENTTPWAREKLFQIVNHRYNYRLSTVFTSNRKPEDIDPRVFSRMSDRALCEQHIMIEAGDFRRMTVDQRYQRYPTNAARRRFQG